MSTSDDRLGSELLTLADEMAGGAASFVAAVESVGAGSDPGAAVAVLMLSLSDILAVGARLGAQEDVPFDGPAPQPQLRRAASLGEPQATGTLSTALAEQFGGVDEYHEVDDPFVGDDIVASRLSADLASIAGDLLQGLALYTEGAIAGALAWWQYSYLSNWGPSASACLRAVQSLAAVVRLGAAMGAPGDDLPL